MGDPSVRWLRARALEEDGRRGEAEPLVADPRAVVTSYGPWWAARARFARLRGEENAAVAFFLEAIGTDPFNSEAACETVAPEPSPPDPVRNLCEAALARGEPPFEGD